jgi:hypothetical protein
MLNFRNACLVEVALTHVDIMRPVVFIRFARAPKTLSEIEICFRFSIVHLEICRFSILTSKRVYDGFLSHIS